MSGEQATKHTDSGLEGVDVVVLVVGQGFGDPIACMCQLSGEVHEHKRIQCIYNDPAHAVRDHLGALAAYGLEDIVTPGVVLVRLPALLERIPNSFPSLVPISSGQRGSLSRLRAAAAWCPRAQPVEDGREG